jgi:probable rRNA maturation factor
MECNIYRTVSKVGVTSKSMKKVVKKVFLLCKKKKPVLSIHLIGDTRMRRLNRDYRGVDSSTDVLSFGVQGAKILGPHEWGDIFISVPYIRRQAKREGVVYREELFRMLIHGILHLFGYDHVTIKEEKKMFALQESILKQCL